MRTIEKIYLRAFTVRIQDQRTGEAKEDVIVFSKHQLQAAQIIGQSSKELICRAYNAQGELVEYMIMTYEYTQYSFDVELNLSSR